MIHYKTKKQGGLKKKKGGKDEINEYILQMKKLHGAFTSVHYRVKLLYTSGNSAIQESPLAN